MFIQFLLQHKHFKNIHDKTLYIHVHVHRWIFFQKNVAKLCVYLRK